MNEQAYITCQQILKQKLQQGNHFILVISDQISKEMLQQMMAGFMHYPQIVVPFENDHSRDDYALQLIEYMGIGSGIQGIMDASEKLVLIDFEKPNRPALLTHSINTSFKLLNENGPHSVFLFNCKSKVLVENEDGLLSKLEYVRTNRCLSSNIFVIALLNSKEYQEGLDFKPFSTINLNINNDKVMNHRIYISYNWEEISNYIVNNIYSALDRHPSVTPVRDKKNCEFGDSISQFEEEIGRGTKIVVVYSLKYLESDACMYEMARIIEEGMPEDRTALVFAGGFTRGFSKETQETHDRLAKQWRKKFAQVKQKFETGKDLDPFDQKCYEVYSLINKHFGEIFIMFNDVNTLNLEQIAENNYAAIFRKLGLEPISVSDAVELPNSSNTQGGHTSIVSQQTGEHAITNNITGDHAQITLNFGMGESKK